MSVKGEAYEKALARANEHAAAWLPLGWRARWSVPAALPTNCVPGSAGGCRMIRPLPRTWSICSPPWQNRD